MGGFESLETRRVNYWSMDYQWTNYVWQLEWKVQFGWEDNWLFCAIKGSDSKYCVERMVNQKFLSITLTVCGGKMRG